MSDWRAFDFLFDLYVMNADGSNVSVLLEGPFFTSDGHIFYYQPAWSPDGSMIAFGARSCESCVSSLRTVKLDGSASTLIFANGHSPSWR